MSHKKRSMTHARPTPTLVFNGLTHELKKHRIYSLKSNPEIVEMNSREDVSVLFALSTAGVLDSVNPAALDILKRSSQGGTPSIALEELVREGAAPGDNLKFWLEEQYLGTWENPADAVQAFIGDYDSLADLSNKEKQIYHSRLAQVANIFQQKLTNGRTAVWLERQIDDFSRMLLCQFIYNGTMPDVFMPN